MGRRSRVAWSSIVAALTVALSLAACAGSGSSADAIDYSAESFPSGEAVSTADLRGDPLLLASWATWCVECEEEMPALERFWRDRRDDGLQVVAVNLNAPGPAEDRIATMAADWGLSMPQWRDADNDFTSAFDGVGVPMVVLLDAEGAIVGTWHGAVDFEDADFLAAVDAAVADA